MPKVSIIIPVYNTEEYLAACIESVRSQSFKDFEVLLVDDGSTDGSGQICDEFVQKDNRFIVFHKENGGVSTARNLGLDNARGEWVYFVDSDDEILPGGLQTLVDCVSDDVDIVLGGYERYDEDGENIYKIGDRVVTMLDKEESLSTLYEGHGKYYDYLTYGCIRLLRNSIIQEQNLRFITSLRNKEDTLFLTQYICRSTGITRFTTAPVYKYNRRSNSAMGKARNGFDYQYVDSLYALIEMKKEIARFYSPFSDIVYVAEEGIWRRYGTILEWMNKFGFEDKVLRKRIKNDVFNEIGYRFLLRKRLRKLKRKCLGNHSHV